MQKIGDITSTANDAGEYTEGNPAAGVESTLIKARWLNVVQRELVHAIEGLGGELDPANDYQLLDTLKKLSPAVHAHAFADLEQIPPALLALSRVTSVSADATLTSAQTGVVQIDANAGSRTITLPTSNGALGVVDVIVRRTDNSGNRLVVKANGTDRIMFHTHLSATGYPFLVLMGAGDWWHLRSDGNGKWIPVGRYDNTQLGRPVFETTTTFSPGGWVAHNGFVYNRAEWPWVWDHAQQSGMLTTEALRVGKEGCWTSGDGTSTFRIPEVRGEFLRVLDEGRGADASRSAGTFQYASLVHGEIVDAVSSFRRMQNLKPKFFEVSESTDGVAVATTQASIASNSQAASSTYFGAVRPRNIAYPGRLKLI